MGPTERLLQLQEDEAAGLSECLASGGLAVRTCSDAAMPSDRGLRQFDGVQSSTGVKSNVIAKALTVGPLWDAEVRATRCAYLVLKGAFVEVVMQSRCKRM